MKKIIIIFIGCILVFTLIYYWQRPIGTRITIANHTFLVDVAVTEAQKEKGLGYRASLKPGTGMIFPYDHKDRYAFWMHGMQFPLDFIWIEDTHVADVTKNVPAPADPNRTDLPVYQPKSPINKILEVNAGDVDTYGIKIGDLVTIRN